MKPLRNIGRIALLLPLMSAAARAMPPVSIEPHVLLHVEAVAVGEGPPRPAGEAKDLEVGPRREESMKIQVPWGDGRRLDVRLDVALARPATGEELVVRCRATVTPSGRPVTRASRDLRIADEATALFEVYGDARGRLVLTLRGERVDRAVAGAIAPPGDPVRFVVAVEGVEGERSAVLETNELHSFVGQSVEYGFQQGPLDHRETIRLVLLPASISGDLITIVAEISGVIPGPDGPSTIERSERIIASRRATTSVSATAGTPPSGYRFQITPDF